MLSESEVVYAPRPGLSVSEVEVAEWIVPDGGSVAEGQPICTLATDKVEVEVEAPSAGVLRHVAALNAVLPVGAELARIDQA
jgi:pyruvate/2-oxoglutarate dehydrogenase complex dihydrolipoamide acyltransferase (E2) component